MDMVHAIMRSKPKPIHTIEIDGHNFVLECDVDQMRKGIESLRGKFDNSKDRYGYQYYRKDPYVNLTEEEYQENIDKFLKEFEKRLEYKHVKEVMEKAVKKKNGTFHKNRVYNEYVLRNAENNGIGGFNVYKVKYNTRDDLAIELIFHYTTEYWG